MKTKLLISFIFIIITMSNSGLADTKYLPGSLKPHITTGSIIACTNSVDVHVINCPTSYTNGLSVGIEKTTSTQDRIQMLIFYGTNKSSLVNLYASDGTGNFASTSLSGVSGNYGIQIIKFPTYTDPTKCGGEVFYQLRVSCKSANATTQPTATNWLGYSQNGVPADLSVFYNIANEIYSFENPLFLISIYDKYYFY